MININELLNKWQSTSKDCQSFDDVMNKSLTSNRECLILELCAEVADVVNSFIRYWNMIDDQNQINPEDRQPIKLYIDSAGGDLMAAFTIIDSIALSETPVETIGIGKVYSGGFFIFIAGNRRIAYPHAEFLYHEGSIQDYGGDAAKFRNFAAAYDKQLIQLKKHTLKYTNIGEELYDYHVKDDWWIDSDEALSLGICDEIANTL